MLIAVFGVVAVLAAFIVGDAATAAAIAGLFSVVNTAMQVAVYRSLRQTRRDVNSAHTSVAHAATSSLAAAEAATEACRVAKSIGRSIRHEDPMIIKRELPPGEAHE
jgi:hypothetical protein